MKFPSYLEKKACGDMTYGHTVVVSFSKIMFLFCVGIYLAIMQQSSQMTSQLLNLYVRLFSAIYVGERFLSNTYPRSGKLSQTTSLTWEAYCAPHPFPAGVYNELMVKTIRGVTLSIDQTSPMRDRGVAFVAI
jgi:hypothetical protein